VANDVLGEAGEDELNRAFRDAKQKYLDSWQGLAQLLGLGDRQAAKDGLTTFFNRLEELEGISRQYGLSKQDPNLRDRLRQDVKNIVIPALNAFVEKHTKLDRCKFARGKQNAWQTAELYNDHSRHEIHTFRGGG
jgi:exocyst complex component 7